MQFELTTEGRREVDGVSEVSIADGCAAAAAAAARSVLHFLSHKTVVSIMSRMSRLWSIGSCCVDKRVMMTITRLRMWCRTG